MTIQKAAHLWVCPGCKGTAKVICSDGTETTKFATKAFGRAQLLELAEERKIDNHELKYLQTELSQTRLQERNDMLEDLFQAYQAGTLHTLSESAAERLKHTFH